MWCERVGHGGVGVLCSAVGYGCGCAAVVHAGCCRRVRVCVHIRDCVYAHRSGVRVGRSGCGVFCMQGSSNLISCLYPVP